MKSSADRYHSELDRRDELLDSLRRTLRNVDDYTRKLHRTYTAQDSVRLSRLRDDQRTLVMSDLDELRRCLRNIEDIENGR
jgi:hypothetical protein